MPTVAIMGDSGAGKTTSFRNADPASTYYVDADKKGLSWRGWRNDFANEKKNYCKCDDPDTVLDLLAGVNTSEKTTGIKLFVVDTGNGLMVADEARRRDEKGYDKWVDLAFAIYDLVDYANTVRDDLTVAFLFHTQTERDESGYQYTRIKTSGKKLDKIVLESKFPAVFWCKVVDGRHVFETQAVNSTAKTPLGCFADLQIPNDAIAAINALREFEGTDPLPAKAGDRS